MAISTVAEYKQLMQVTTSADDAMIAAALDNATAIIEQNATSLLFSSQTITEYYSGGGRTSLVLRSRPVTAISSIYYDDTGYFGAASGFGSSSLLSSGVDYVLELTEPGISMSGVVHRIGGVWGKSRVRVGSDLVGYSEPGIGNIKITYTAGYDGTTWAIPSNIKLLNNLLARQIIRIAPTAGSPISSESFEYYSYSLKQESPSDYATISSLMGAIREYVF